MSENTKIPTSQDENLIDEHEYLSSKVEDSNKQVAEHAQKGSSKRKWIIAIFVLANALAIGLTVLLEFNREGEKYPLSTVLDTWLDNFPYVICAFLCTALYLLFDGLKYEFILKRITGKAQLPLSLKISTLGRYYDNITPLAIGGQPFQIYYLHKANVPAGAATAMPIASFFFTQLSLVILSIIVFIFNSSVISDPAMIWTAYIGAFFSIFVPFLIVFFSLFPKTAWKITNACLKLLHKIRIIKDFNEMHQCFGRVALPQPFPVCRCSDDELKKYIAEHNIACAAGILTARIAPNGNVTPCPVIESPVLGNVNSENFSDIWNRFQKTKWQKKMPKSCCCNCQFLQNCGGGCLAQDDSGILI